jgi:LacI family transcriptional regulator
VGFVMRDISNPLFAEVVKGAERELERHGYSMLLMNSLQDPLLDARHIRLLRQRRVDGLILSLQSETNPDTMTALSETAAPIVLVDREIPGVRADSIVLDHFAGVHSAVTALLDAGHRRMALIAGPDDIRSSRERRRGFVSAHEDAGIEFDDSLLLLGSYTRDFGFKAATALLAGDSPPTAIVAGGIQLGIGLLAAINDLGLRSGRNVSVVVCDDVELMRLMDPPVSVVARDADEMGRVAARLLVERLRDPDAPARTEVLPTYYVPRGSTTTVPA